MRDIKKGPEPEALRAHRLSDPAADYDGLTREAKDDLCVALLKEQGAVCCYCTQRIRAATMKIEHRQPQSLYPERQLDWKNLLGACPGGQGRRLRFQHCDTRKGDQEISLDPVAGVERQLRYLSNGELRAGHPDPQHRADLDRELDEVLNLNLDPFKRARLAALEGLKRKKPRGDWKAAFLRRELEVLRGRSRDGLLTPHTQLAITNIERRLKRA